MDLNCCRTKESKNRLSQVAEFLKIIGEPNRLRIICLLRTREMCVCEIWQYLNLPQNLVSHHLKVLKNFGLVNSNKENTKVIYSINKKAMKTYGLLLGRYIQVTK